MLLSDLIKQLTEIYNEEGEKSVAIMRKGVMCEEIEVNNCEIQVYLEAYTPYDR